MASQDEIERLVGHAALNDSFRQWLFTEPEAAAKSLGIFLTQAQADYIKGLGPSAGDELSKCIGVVMPPTKVWSG